MALLRTSQMSRRHPFTRSSLVVVLAVLGTPACRDDEALRPADAAAGEPHVRIRANESVGSLSPWVESAGIWFSIPVDTWQHPHGYPKEEYLAETRPGVVQFTQLVQDVFRSSACYSGCAQSFEELLSSDHVDAMIGWMVDVQAKGGKVVLAFDPCPVPAWLSSCEQDFTATECAKANDSTTDGGEANAAQCPLINRYLPADLDLWASMVEEMAARLRAAGLEMSYVTYHEPEPPWGLRTDRDYFEFHRASVLGIKRADPDALIGTFGATGGLTHVKFDSVTGVALSDRPMMRDFVRYCAENALPEVGLSRIPIDFVNWHQFHVAPRARGWKATIDLGKSWLSESGYEPNVPFYPGDWNLWDNVPTYPPGTLSQDTEVASSYVVASIIAMESAGVAWQSLDFDVDMWTKPTTDTQFEGRWPLFTAGLVKKASYNALRMISAFQATEAIAIDVSDPIVAALGGKDASGNVFVLASNFVPTTFAMSKEWAAGILADRGFDAKSLEREGITNTDLLALAKGTKTVADLHVSGSELARALEDAVTLVQLFEARKSSPLNLRLVIDGMPDGPARRTVHVIDAEHANAHRIAGEVDATVAAAEAQANEDGKAAVASAVATMSYTPAEIEALKSLFAACRTNPAPVLCARNWLSSHAGTFAKPDDEVLTDLGVLLRAYQQAYRDTYTARIDALNGRPEIDFLPTEDGAVQVVGGAHIVEMSLAPYAAVLIRLEPGR